jgi:hypothetical protein
MTEENKEHHRGRRMKDNGFAEKFTVFQVLGVATFFRLNRSLRWVTRGGLMDYHDLPESQSEDKALMARFP